MLFILRWIVLHIIRQSTHALNQSMEISQTRENSVSAVSAALPSSCRGSRFSPQFCLQSPHMLQSVRSGPSPHKQTFDVGSLRGNNWDRIHEQSTIRSRQMPLQIMLLLDE